MLRPIYRVASWNGLAAGFDLQLKLARWLCEPATTRAAITKAGLAAVHPHVDVQSWLWHFLRPRADRLRLLKAARAVASQSAADKQVLRAWVDVVSDLGAQFQPNPPQWLEAPKKLNAWKAFR